MKYWLVILLIVFAPVVASGQSLDFDGTDDYVTNTSHSSALDFGSSTDFTASAWIKTATTERDDIMGAGNAQSDLDGKHWEVFVRGDQNGELGAFIDDGTNTTKSTFDGASVNDDVWHHVVVVYDRDGNMIRYVDGSQTGTKDSISSVGDITSDVKTISIGKRGDNSVNTDNFPGLIDDVRIYNQTLSEAEVKQLYTHGRGRVRKRTLGAASSGMVGHWPFNEASIGTDATTVTIRDRSGNGNDGTANDGDPFPTLLFDEPALIVD